MFKVIDPSPVVPVAANKVRELVATTRPRCYTIGWSSMDDLQQLAAQAQMAGEDVLLHEVRRRAYFDVVYDLYIVHHIEV